MGGGVSREFDDDRTNEELIGELRTLRDENGVLKRSLEVLRAGEDGSGGPVHLALLRTEALLADAQKLAHIGSWNLDLTTDTLTWSDEQYRIFGLNPGSAAMTLNRFASLIHPDDRALVQSNCENAIRSGDHYEACYRALREDGTERIVQARGQVVFDDGGNPVRMFGSAQDITDQKLAEESLRKSERRAVAIAERLAILHDTDRAILAARSPVQIAVDRWSGLQNGPKYAQPAGGSRLSAKPRGNSLAARIGRAPDLEEFPESIGTPFEYQARRAVAERVVRLHALGVRSYARVPLTTEGPLLVR